MAFRLLSLTLLVLLVAAVVVWSSREQAVAAPVLSMKTIDGESLKLEPDNGRATLVTFWATSCVVCIEEIPALTALYGELAGRGLDIVAVAAHYDVPLRVIKTAEHRGIPYPVVLDLDRSIARAFRLERTVTPTSFLIGPDGRVVLKRIGRMDMAELRATIEQLLLPA